MILDLFVLDFRKKTKSQKNIKFFGKIIFFIEFGGTVEIGIFDLRKILKKVDLALQFTARVAYSKLPMSQISG